MLARTPLTTWPAAELDQIGAGIGDFDPLLLFKKAGERVGQRMKNPGPMKPGVMVDSRWLPHRIPNPNGIPA
jgi:hypothetical protein